MTMATDYLLAIGSWTFAYRLVSARRDTNTAAAVLWAAGFVLVGLGAAAGGTFHGFTRALSPALLSALWEITCLAVGLGTLLMLVAAARQFLSRWWVIMIATAAVVKFILYAVEVARNDDFRTVIGNYAIVMIAILVIALFDAVAWKGTASRWIIAGIAVSFAAAAVQAMRIAPHHHFNHNDLYHVVQLIGLWMIYRGAGARQGLTRRLRGSKNECGMLNF